MSTEDTVEDDVCANCGKGEEESGKLKPCTACKMVKYCNRECQIAHRPQHKKECRKRAAELHDEKLFKQPPAEEDCPICFIRLPSLKPGSKYHSCCGKMICNGCCYAPVYDDQGNLLDNDKQNECPFCRTLAPKSKEEATGRIMKRMEMGDVIAIYNIGIYYQEGLYGFPQGYAKALELWHRAGEQGYAAAYCSIGNAYLRGRGVEIDKEKARYYYELAAMMGNVVARHNLGCIEAEAGNMDRALKHYMIAVRDGESDSLEQIKVLYSNGYTTKEDYTKALQSYQTFLGEIKSAQRDKAAEEDEEDRYY